MYYLLHAPQCLPQRLPQRLTQCLTQRLIMEPPSNERRAFRRLNIHSAVRDSTNCEKGLCLCIGGLYFCVVVGVVGYWVAFWWVKLVALIRSGGVTVWFAQQSFLMEEMEHMRHSEEGDADDVHGNIDGEIGESIGIGGSVDVVGSLGTGSIRGIGIGIGIGGINVDGNIGVGGSIQISGSVQIGGIVISIGISVATDTSDGIGMDTKNQTGGVCDNVSGDGCGDSGGDVALILATRVQLIVLLLLQMIGGQQLTIIMQQVHI